jgi:indole-3-glycerol phosphate synthase
MRTRRRSGGPAVTGSEAQLAGDVLARIVAGTRAAVAERRQRVPIEQLEAEAVPRLFPWSEERRFAVALSRPGVGAIAEFKRRSPSAGEIRPGATVAEIVAAYERGGARALSVLTEQAHFGGSLEDLRAARAASDLPILRKDFIVDAYQLHEARSAGADAVLLIVAALSDAELRSLQATATELQLDVLVEVHGPDELDRALALRPTLLGINNRDLRDFSLDVGRTQALLDRVPAGVRVVSESGIGQPQQLVELQRLGVAAVLVGESLMRARNPETALRRLLAGVADRPAESA